MGYFLTNLITVSFSRTSVLHGVNKDMSKLHFSTVDALVDRVQYEKVRNFRLSWNGVSRFEIYPEFA